MYSNHHLKAMLKKETLYERLDSRGNPSHLENIEEYRTSRKE